MMIKFEEIRQALSILDLGDTASLKQINANYRKMIHQWHPDKCRESAASCHEQTRKIINARKLLVDYCENHQFLFDEDSFKPELSEKEMWEKQWGKNDPVFGDNKK